MNNHARTKRKRKVLRLKNFHKRVMQKRLDKIVKANKPKGETIVGKAALVARQVYVKYKGDIEISRIIKASKRGGKNQRQIRKMRRQCPNSKKWAA